MKLLLIPLASVLLNSSVVPKDDPFSFHSPFGSDGTNQPNLTPAMRNDCVFDHVWDAYGLARKEITAPLPVSTGGYSKEQVFTWMTALRYGELLETMVELRAFCTQNGYDRFAVLKPELARIDAMLRSLKLRYEDSHSGQRMVDLCMAWGPNKTHTLLNPFLFQADGNLRSLPPITFSFDLYR